MATNGKREAAIQFLLSNAQFRRLYKGDVEDLGLAQAQRYVRGLQRAEREGREVRHMGELRGHVYTEHHAGRRNKPGYEDYVPPPKVPRGWSFYDRATTGRNQPAHLDRMAYAVRVTSGERAAVQAIAGNTKEIRDPGSRRLVSSFLSRRLPGRHIQVAINVTGTKQGQYAQLFWHGGWNGQALLQAAGYRKDKAGLWRLTPGGEGLKAFLLRYINNNIPKSWRGKTKWEGIALIEVHLASEPIRFRPDPAVRLQDLAPAPQLD